MQDRRLSKDRPSDFIDENDPMPTVEEPEGRWAAPYISEKTGLPTVFTRRPLNHNEVHYGLKSCLVAETLGRLKELMDEEDEKHRGFVALNQGSRNTG